VRLTKEQIGSILDLYEKGSSLTKISKIIDKSKTTIYYHVRKAFGRKYEESCFNEKYEREIGEFMGSFAGDGNFHLGRKYGYRIRFYLASYEDEYAERLSGIMLKVFNKRSNIYLNKNSNCIEVGIFSRRVYEEIKNHLDWGEDKTFSIKLRNSIKDYSDEFLKGFVTGLFNTDGNVYIPKSKVSVSSISKCLIEQVSDILAFYGIRHYIYRIHGSGNRKDIYHLTIKVSDVPLFDREIGITNPYKNNQMNKIIEKRS
jgi:hypothetical protein